MNGAGGTIPGEPLLERLGLGTNSLVVLARRLVMVAAVAAVLSAAMFALVETTAPAANARRPGRVESVRERLSQPRFSRAPAVIVVQLVIVGIAALAGRKVLRLRL
jgi:type IV secretory pathway VirB2 component (pilin)